MVGKNQADPTSPIFDLEAAARLLKLEAFGDWYRDPWSWFEFEESLMKDVRLEEDLGFRKSVDKGVGGFAFDVEPVFHLLTVPKSFTGVRPGVVIDPASKLVYTAAASQIASRVHSQLPEWVYGWRLRDSAPSSTTDEWQLYEESARSIGVAKWALQTDITSFFASTDIANLVEDIKASVGRTAAIDAVHQVLTAHSRLPERRGLPQRCYASSYLANMAVTAVDDVVVTAISEGRITSARRWMDDYSFESKDLQALYKLIIDIQAAMRRSGLEINTAKTHLTNGKDSHDLFKRESPDRIKLKALLAITDYDDLDFEDEEGDPPVDFAPLERAEARLLANVKGINRGEGAMVLKALRKYEKTDRYLEWRNIAHQLPHLADTLGRYFAVAMRHNRGAKKALTKWFVVFAESQWASVDWVSAQYAMAFASDNLPGEVGGVLDKWLRHGRNLQQVSLAAQRLAVSNPERVRSIVGTRSSTETDPHLQRALALGLLAAGAKQRDVVQLLERSPHHRLTLRALEKRKWKLPTASSDFDPIADSK